MINWITSLNQFIGEMMTKILQNIPEKGYSWRTVGKDYLYGCIQKYAERHDWVSVANIAFMLWEREQK